MYKKLVLINILIVLTLFTFSKTYSTNLLFLTYDYGDANAFKAILPSLKKNDFDYEIIALGKSNDLFQNNLVNEVNCLSNFDNDFLIKDRNNTITKSNIECLKNTLINKPDIIVSGMSSAALADILNSYSSQVKIAYYDNFDPYPKNSRTYYTNSFVTRLNNYSLDSVFITSETIKSSFIKNFNNKKFVKGTKENFLAVGNPSIISWETDLTKCSTREEIKTKLNIPKNKKIVVFAGDTTPDYAIAIEHFAKALKEMPNYEAIVSPHPKTNGEIERNIKEKYQINNMIIASPSDIATICLTNLSKVFIVHKSSMGIQALSNDKNVIYIADSSYENIAIQKAVAKRAFSTNNIINTIQNEYNEKASNEYSKLGIPKYPIKSFIDKLNKIRNTKADNLEALL